MGRFEVGNSLGLDQAVKADGKRCCPLRYEALVLAIDLGDALGRARLENGTHLPHSDYGTSGFVFALLCFVFKTCDVPNERNLIWDLP